MFFGVGWPEPGHEVLIRQVVDRHVVHRDIGEGRRKDMCFWSGDTFEAIGVAWTKDDDPLTGTGMIIESGIGGSGNGAGVGVACMRCDDPRACARRRWLCRGEVVCNFQIQVVRIGRIEPAGNGCSANRGHDL